MMKSPRRCFSFNSLWHCAALFFVAAGAFSLTAQGAGFKDAAAQAYLNIGTAVGQDPSRISFDDILEEEFNILVCENAMKFSSTEPSRGRFTFNGGDALVDFAEDNDMLMRGHTLVWHSQTSSWVTNGDFNRAEMLQIMEDHITEVVSHYRGQILEWDVVNEAVADNGRGLRNSFWRDRIGDDFIDSAFVYAHRADPDALLYYNDYGADWINAKSDYIYNMVEGMLERGIPIHGIGLQCHLSGTVNKSGVSSNIERFGELGLRVSLTEVDIRNSGNNGTTWSNLMEACLENYNCTSFLTWGAHDGISWLGRDCDCLIWNNQQQPKAVVYEAVLNALENADPDVSEQRSAFINHTVNAGERNRTPGRQTESARFTFNGRDFSYSLPEDRDVHVLITDGRGKTAADLNLGAQTSGMHTIRWAYRQFPAGAYFAKIRWGDRTTIVPFTLLAKKSALTK